MVTNSLKNTNTTNNNKENDNFTQIYKYEDAYAESLQYFNNNDFAAKVFVDKYALRDKEDRLVEKTPEDTHRRLAREFARIEKNKFKNPLTEDQIFYYLDKFSKIIPQGSPMFAIGNPFQIVSSSNCFVIDSPLDSYSSILKSDEELAQISKRRGGVGLDISHIRPNGSLTSNSSRTSTGIVPFMCRYSNTIREVGQCLHGDTLVLTSSGLERIKNINKGDSVWTENGWKKVISTHQTNKETIKIKTKKGRTIICSKDHPFHTINGEKEASQFIKGDNVTYIVGQEWYGSDFILDPIEYKKSSYNNSNRLNEINYPEKLDTDFAYFIGYSYGDGFVSYDENKISGISLSCDRKWKYISEKLIEISKKILNKENISFRERKNENCDEIRITSRCLVEFLQHNNLLKQKSENIEFPEKLLKSKKDILFSFISGYFDADGSVVKTKKAYKLSSINYSFLQTIQCIFSSFGICSTIHHSERKYNWKDIYELYINGKKSQKIFKNLMTESIKVSKITFNEKRRDCYRTEYKTENFSTNSSRHSYIIDNNQYLSYSTVERLASELSLENNYFLLQDEIKEISEYEKDTILYDIGLEDTHFFFANGLYVHNSGRRGALMLTISIHHPESVIPWDNSVDGEPYDVEVHNPSLGSFVISSKYYNPKKIDFATSKYDPSKVTGANISIRLSDEFLNALEKDDYFEQRWPVDSENPVIRKKVRAKDVWEKIIHSAWRTAEPGLLFWDTIIKESPADCYYDYGFRSLSTNPCLTYETNVAVADGRGFIEIGKLAEEGLDVPVYCCDDKGKIVVRTMRNPRITGYNEDVYKVTLDDGSSFKCTGNHKIMLNNGEYVEALKLQSGDSLHIGKKYESTIVDSFKNQPKTRNEKLYYILKNSLSNFRKTEHRYIYEYYFGSIPKKCVIHHKDHNSKNNKPNNLESMNKYDHIKYHAINMIGNKNPIFKIKADADKFTKYSKKMSESCSGLKNGNSIDISNEEIKNHALKLTKDIGRRFSRKEWIKYANENNLPKAFTEYREQELGSVIDIAKTCAKECGFNDEEINLDPRLIKTLNKARKQGYDCYIDNNTIFVIKRCVHCGLDFSVLYTRREQCTCGNRCSNFYVNKNTDTNKRRTETINSTYQEKANKNKKQQLDIYTKLKFELNRKPMLKEFEQECFKNKVSCRLNTKYGFKKFTEIEEQALIHNHRVVSVEYVGKEVVYNGTVDEFHNFYMGGWEFETENGKKEWIMVNSKNCGEIVLSPNDSCRLLALNLFGFVVNPFSDNAYFDYKNFYETSKIAQRLMDDLIDIELECVRRILDKIENDPEPKEIKSREKNLWLKVYEACENGRRTGTGILALGDTLAALNIKYGTEDGVNEVDKIYKTLKFACYQSSVEMAKELGSFKVWDKEIEKDNPFLNRFKNEIVDLGGGEVINGIDIWNEMQKYGRRNIALLTTAPTGSISNLAKLANNFGTSSGIEPQYSITPYTRKKKGNPGDKNFRSDSVDQNGDHWMHFKIYPSAVQEWIDITGENDITKSPWYKNTAEDIDWSLRVTLQAKANAHIDHSISSCLVIGEHAITTSFGIMDIGEFGQAGEKEFSKIDDIIFSVNKNGEMAQISEFYNNGIENTIIIEVEGGRSIRCTPNHKLCIIDNNYNLVWKEAKDISYEDVLVSRKGLNLWNENSKYISMILGKTFDYEKLSNSKDVKKIQRVTPKLSKLLGYLCSDGHVGVNGIGITQQNNNCLIEFGDIVKDLFGVDCKIEKDNRVENLYISHIYSREISSFFKYLGLTNHDEIRVPKIIMMSGKKCVKEFIKGATLNGHVAENGICVATSVSKKYLIDIQNLLLNLGIEASIIKKSEPSERLFPSGRIYNTKQSHVLFISNNREVDKFIQEIGFAEDRKNMECISKYRRPSRIKIKGEIPDFGLRDKFRQNNLKNIRSNRLYDFFHSLTCSDKMERFIDRESILEMKDMGLEIPAHIVDDTYLYSKIKNIRDGGMGYTADISVPNGNSYLANGFISHNTVNIPNNTSVEKVAEIYETAWRSKCKGITVYRDGCRTGVLVRENKDTNNKTDFKLNKTDAPKRPKSLECDVHHIKVQGEEYFVLVGMFHGEVYEIFAGKNGMISKEVKKGEIKKVKRGHYQAVLDNGEIIDNVCDFITDDQAAITRLASLSLRHGSDIKHCVTSLEKVPGDMTSLAKSMARALKKYIKDGEKQTGIECGSCGSENIIRQEGCITCRNCGWSKCS